MAESDVMLYAFYWAPAPRLIDFLGRLGTVVSDSAKIYGGESNHQGPDIRGEVRARPASLALLASAEKSNQ